MSPVSVWEFVQTLDAAATAEVGRFRAQGRVPPSNCPQGTQAQGFVGIQRARSGVVKGGPPHSPADSTASVRA